MQLGQDAETQPRLTIVGVVPDLYMGSLEERDPNGPGVYLPLTQNAHVSMQLMVRTTGDPLTLTSQIRDVLESVDPRLALMNVDRVDRLISRETLIFVVFGKLFLFFGLTALFLASTGLYGVIAFTVGQRTREWGVRMALGARSGDVVLLVAKQGARQLAIGLGIGLVASGLVSMPLTNLFYQVEPWDPLVFSLIALIMSGTAALATFVPARRATRVDPLEAMRSE
jgi:ABC-type antimicrobial peptide transport system permease subunit